MSEKSSGLGADFAASASGEAASSSNSVSANGNTSVTVSGGTSQSSYGGAETAPAAPASVSSSFEAAASKTAPSQAEPMSFKDTTQEQMRLKNSLTQTEMAIDDNWQHAQKKYQPHSHAAPTLSMQHETTQSVKQRYNREKAFYAEAKVNAQMRYQDEREEMRKSGETPEKHFKKAAIPPHLREKENERGC